MFKWITKMFSVAPTEGVRDITTGETEMIGKIIETGNSFALVDRHSNTVATYSRRRDAVRGAARRGFVVKA